MGEVNLNYERRWLLEGWGRRPGWGINLRTEKKWIAHLTALLKAGLVEQSGEGRAAMYRITDLGRSALQQKGRE